MTCHQPKQKKNKLKDLIFQLNKHLQHLLSTLARTPLPNDLSLARTLSFEPSAVNEHTYNFALGKVSKTMFYLLSKFSVFPRVFRLQTFTSISSCISKYINAVYKETQTMKGNRCIVFFFAVVLFCSWNYPDLSKLENWAAKFYGRK